MLMFKVVPKNLHPGDSADTLIDPTGCSGVHVNPSVTPFIFTGIDGNPERLVLHCWNGTPVGEFVGLGAEENAYRLLAMLRLCDGIGTNVLLGLHGKLSRILDTKEFMSAKCWLTEGSVMTSERNAKT